MIGNLANTDQPARRERRKKIAESAPTSSTQTDQQFVDDEPKYRPIDWRLSMRILSRLAPYKWRYAAGVSLSLLMLVLEMCSPLFVAALVNHAATFLTGQSAMSQSDAIRRVVGIIALWAVILGCAILLQRITILIMTGAGEAVQFNLRRDLFAQLQRLSMSFYDRTKLGRIMSRCTSDIASLREINVWGIDTVVKNSLMMLIAAIMLLHTDPRLFASVAWLGVVLLICNRIYRRKIGVAYQKVREGFTRVQSNIAENITGVRVVTAFDRQTRNLGVFNKLQDANTANALETSRINGLYQPLLQFIGLTGKIIILVYGGYLATCGRIVGGVGSVVAAFLYWDWFMGPILTFGNFFNQLMAAMAGAERVFDLLDATPEVCDVSSAQALNCTNGRVEFDRVTFGYKPELPVLHDISFTVEPGSMIALVGRTGAGKSSIISLIARFYQPQSGRVLIDGQDIRFVTGESLHAQMGIVLQSSFLFTGSVADNIRHARPDASDADIERAARAIGTYDLMASLPSGFQTVVGERGATLSLGQRQLVCFTRAFLADPRILLLDEATSSIDSATELLIQRALDRLRAGRTTFVVAHRLSTIQRADCIMVIDGGSIIERGTHEELLQAQGKYAKMHREFTRRVE